MSDVSRGAAGGDDDTDSHTARSLRERVTRRLHGRLLTALAVVTSVTLVAAFYYPVGTVLIEAVVVDGVPTLAVFAELLRDPFYFGEFARLFAGESPLAVARDLLGPDRRLGIVGFTAYQAALSTVASVALGLPAAYLLARFEFPGRRTLRSLTIVPFVLPSIMVAVGFVATFGTNGTLNRVLGALGLPPVDLMFTLEAVVIAHAFYNAPLVARVTTAAWESVDASAVETARSLGAGPIRAFYDVVAPQVYPAVLTGAALTFVFTFGTFPIVLALGGFQLATVEVFVYRLVRDLSYAEAAALAIVELVISLGVLLAYLRYEARNTVSSRGVRPLPRKPLVPASPSLREVLPRVGLAAYAVVAGLVFLAPIASMVLASVTGGDGVLTLDHYRFLIDRQQTGAAFQVRPWPAIRNSLAFASAATLLALPMGVVVAVLTTRRYRGRKLVDAAAMAPLAVSGIIVGLGLLRGLVFGVEIAGWRFAATGAVAIVVAHAVAGYPFVVRTVAPGLEGLDRSLIESARALGASRARVIRDVELPLVWPGVVAGAAFAFAISIGEFTATVVLATGADAYTMPVAIERFIGRRLGPATAMGVVLLVVTGLSFVVIERLGVRRVDFERSATDAAAEAAATDHAPPAVELDGVTKRYGDTVAVDDVSLRVREGEFFTLVGPSGCGKTTTLRLIAGFEEPTAGTIRFSGDSVAGVPPEDRDVGVVFQNYALFSHMTVGENVGYGLNFADPPEGATRDERVAALLELVDLPDAADRDPESLSGGQRQRVAMARALAPGPDLLLLDEPMSALDAQLRERLRVQVRRIQSELGITTVYVTHDQEEALAISDRVAVMRDGRPEQVAPPRTVYREPSSRFVAEFVGDNNVFAGRVVDVDVNVDAGEADGGSQIVGVDVDGETLRVEVGDANDVAEGDRLTFCVRPEYLRIGAGDSRLAATVASAEFLGETTRVTLDWAGRDLVVRTRDPLSGEVVVGFDPEDAHVIDTSEE